MVRPLVPSDLEAFHKLRANADLQNKSMSRGRPDKDLEESELNLARLQSPYDEQHWYFGAFLASTGELIGEGGIPDTDGNTRSGWPDIDLLIAVEHQRQGYGTELLKAVLDSWWKLPRERRRRQLNPIIVPGLEPGDNVIDSVIFQWESKDTHLTKFFAKVLGESVVAVKGTVEDFDRREGRTQNLITFHGMLLTNPIPFVDEDKGSDDDDDDGQEDLDDSWAPGEEG